jgi:hypothetical protein
MAMDSARRLQAVEILQRSWQTLNPVWHAYRRQHGRTRDGYRTALLLPRINDIQELRTNGGTSRNYYEESKADTMWPEHGTPYTETNTYTIGYLLVLQKQLVYWAGLRRVRSEQSQPRLTVQVVVQWHGEPALSASRQEYPATADGWQRLITDHGWGDAGSATSIY